MPYQVGQRIGVKDSIFDNHTAPFSLWPPMKGHFGKVIGVGDTLVEVDLIGSTHPDHVKATCWACGPRVVSTTCRDNERMWYLKPDEIEAVD